MTNTEAMYILTKLIINVPHSRGDGKSLTKSQIVEALAMGINALNVLLAYAHAQKGEVCYVIINCTIMLMSMMQLIR